MTSTKRFSFFIRALLFLEFHEVLTLLMLVFVTFIYQIRLHETMFDVVLSIAISGSSITKLFFILLLCLGIFTWLIRHSALGQKSKLAFRMLTSFFLMLIIFESITHFIKAIGLVMYDAQLQQLDRLLFFGKQPAEWLEPMISHPFTLILSGAYLSWFILTYGTVLLLVFRSRQAVLSYAASALVTFYMGYLIYLLVPGLGPMYTYSFSIPMGGLTALLENPNFIQPAADVFPSLHTAISVVMLVEVWRSHRIWTALYAPIVFLIIFSTIYLRIHYAVDVIAGILLAVWVTAWSPSLLKFWKRLQDSNQNSSQNQEPPALPSPPLNL